MKKLLNVLHKKWFIVMLVAIFACLAVYVLAEDSDGEVKEVTYDYRYYNSFRNGMPDYGLRKRRNILPYA